MHGRRRFELKKGNKELFWEIWRNGGTINTRSGQLIREEQGIDKEKKYENYQLAEVEFDRLIRARIQKGYVEVYKASEFTQINDKREVLLSTLSGNIIHYLNVDMFHKIFTWMVDPLFIVDKREPVASLEKWERRALRLCRFDDYPEDEEDFETFVAKLREITLDDRKKSRLKDIIPGYKFTDPQYWIINPEEAELIFQKSSIVLKKRIASRVAKGQEPTQKQVLFQEWLDFNEKAMKHGGYEVRPISHRFETNQGTTSLGLDELSFMNLSTWMQEMDIFDEEASGPEDIQEEIQAHRNTLLEQQKNASIRISRNETQPQRKKYESFRKKFFNATAHLRSHSTTVGKISLYKFAEPDYFWSISAAETKAILVTIRLQKEELSSTQQVFVDFLEKAAQNKGFRLNAIDVEEELIEYFVDHDADDSEEYEYEEDYEDAEEHEDAEDEAEEEDSSSDSSSDED